MSESGTGRDVNRVLKLSLIETKYPERYFFYPIEKQRTYTVEIGRKICEYVHYQKIDEILLIDRGARPAFIIIRENWRHMYPNDKIPNVSFINPKGLRTTEEVAHDFSKLAFDKEKALKRNDNAIDSGQIRTSAQVDKDLVETYPRLFTKSEKKSSFFGFGQKKDKVFVFDTCLHSGYSIETIIDKLKKAGKDVKLGLISNRDNTSEIKPDMVCWNNNNEPIYINRHDPFNSDRLVVKTYESVHSTPTPDKDEITLSKRIREELANAVSDYYEAKKMPLAK